MRGTRGSGVVAAVLVLGCGCSFVMVRRAPEPPPAYGAPLECTRSRVAPGLDTAGAIATPILGLSTWALCSFVQSMQSWSSDPRILSCRTVLWTTLGLTAAYTGSAVYGFHETGQCRQLAAQEPPQAPPGPARPLPAHLAPAPP